MSKQPPHSESRKDAIALTYAKLAAKLDKYPSRAELNKHSKVTRDMIRDHFGDMEALREYASEKHQDLLQDIITLEYFSNDLYREQVEIAKRHKRHVITTAVSGAPIHEEFLAAILNYCEHNDAALWVIPADYALAEIDRELLRNPKVNIVFKAIHLNKKAVIDPIRIDPKQVDPATGLDAFAHDEGTVLIGSPKQRRVPLANAHGKIAPVIQATGAVTRPRYYSKGEHRRRNRLAKKHHVMGAVVVEIQDDKIHFPRNVMMSRDGSFNDLYHNYASDEIKPTQFAAVVPGDWHVGATDPTTREIILEVCKLGMPEYLVLHDFTDFASINPHEEENVIMRSLKFEQNMTLDREMSMNAEEIKFLRSKKPARKKILFVDSNHPDFLPRYLRKGRFADHDRRVATKLQLLALDGKDPYVDGLKEFYGVQAGKDIQFLTINQEFRVRGVELAAHGHLGANGKRNPGSKGMFKSFGKVSYGHCHYGEIWHSAMSSGTSTHMHVGYNDGASSWDRSFQIVHDDGTRQLVSIIHGKYRI